MIFPWYARFPSQESVLIDSWASEVALLLSFGADTLATDHLGRTAYALAKSYKYQADFHGISLAHMIS